MKIHRRVIFGGRCINVVDTISHFKSATARKRKSHPSTQAMKEINERASIRYLACLIAANFCGGDLHIVLTYDRDVRIEEAKDFLAKFHRAARRLYKLHDMQYKYIVTTETMHNGRIHHHLIVPRIDYDLLCRIWRRGSVQWKEPLKDTDEYVALANYLVKESKDTFREEGNPFKQRYSCSKGMIKPEQTISEISFSEYINEDISTLIPGAYLLENTVKEYTNPATGGPVRECYLVVDALYAVGNANETHEQRLAYESNIDIESIVLHGPVRI